MYLIVGINQKNYGFQIFNNQVNKLEIKKLKGCRDHNKKYGNK